MIEGEPMQKLYIVSKIDLLNDGNHVTPLITLNAEEFDDYFGFTRKKSVIIKYNRFIVFKHNILDYSNCCSNPIISNIRHSYFSKVENYHPFNKIFFNIVKDLDRFEEKNNLYIFPVVGYNNTLYLIHFKVITDSYNFFEKSKKIKEFDKYVGRIVLPGIENYVHPIYIPDLKSEKERKKIESKLEKILNQIKKDFNL
jgi:hypothetical protein